SSVAEKVTGVVPSVRNGGASLVTVTVESQTSAAEAPAKKPASCGSSFAMPLFPVHSTTTSEGQDTTGAVVSWTRTFTKYASGRHTARSVRSSRQSTSVLSGKKPLGVGVSDADRTMPGHDHANVRGSPSGSVEEVPFKPIVEPPVLL